MFWMFNCTEAQWNIDLKCFECLKKTNTDDFQEALLSNHNCFNTEPDIQAEIV